MKIKREGEKRSSGYWILGRVKRADPESRKTCGTFCHVRRMRHLLCVKCRKSFSLTESRRRQTHVFGITYVHVYAHNIVLKIKRVSVRVRRRARRFTRSIIEIPSTYSCYAYAPRNTDMIHKWSINARFRTH